MFGFIYAMLELLKEADRFLATSGSSACLVRSLDEGFTLLQDLPSTIEGYLMLEMMNVLSMSSGMALVCLPWFVEVSKTGSSADLTFNNDLQPYASANG